MRNVFLIIFFGIHFAFGQTIKIPLITPEQKENANTVKISALHIIEYKNFNKVTVSNKYVVLVLNEVGFKYISLRATGGWHAAMAQMLGLWVRRSPLGDGSRKYLSYLLKPLIRYLIKKDKKFPVEFIEGQMITGLYGIAFK